MKFSLFVPVARSTVAAAINSPVTAGKDNYTVSWNGMSAVLLCGSGFCDNFSNCMKVRQVHQNAVGFRPKTMIPQ
jgi:hypothetical protein